MPRQCPCDATILQLLRTDLAGEGAVRFIEDVLRRDFDTFAEVFPGDKKVESWRRDNDLLGDIHVSIMTLLLIRQGLLCQSQGYMLRRVVMSFMYRCWDLIWHH